MRCPEGVDPAVHVLPRVRDLALAGARLVGSEAEVDLVVQAVAFRRKPLLLGYQLRQFRAETVDARLVHGAAIGSGGTRS